METFLAFVAEHKGGLFCCSAINQQLRHNAMVRLHGEALSGVTTNREISCEKRLTVNQWLF